MGVYMPDRSFSWMKVRELSGQRREERRRERVGVSEREATRALGEGQVERGPARREPQLG